MFMFQSVMGWLMAAIYLGAGVPLAWILWYRRIYSACKHDSALGFLWFFIVFLVHIGFCICACCAFPNPAGTLWRPITGDCLLRPRGPKDVNHFSFTKSQTPSRGCQAPRTV